MSWISRKIKNANDARERAITEADEIFYKAVQDIQEILSKEVEESLAKADKKYGPIADTSQYKDSVKNKAIVVVNCMFDRLSIVKDSMMENEVNNLIIQRNIIIQNMFDEMLSMMKSGKWYMRLLGRINKVVRNKTLAYILKEERNDYKV